MEHVAIDLGGRESQICVRSADGAVIEERREATKHLRGYLRQRSKSRVIVETCAEAFAIADAALEAGHEVRVVPSALVKSLGVGARGVKNDRRDAQVLSEISTRINLPSVHVPSHLARERKSICSLRDALVGGRTKLINSVHGWLRTQTTHPRSGAAESFPRRVREHFEKHHATAVPEFVERQLRAIDALSLQIADADQELRATADGDPICERLMTVPGVGPLTAVRFVAAVDDVSRFGKAHAVESYLGLVPGEDSSSSRQRRTGITKAGSPQLRWTLVQAAWNARLRRPNDPMVMWSREVEQRRGKRVAVVALARKIVGVLYALWRDGTRYTSTR
jgi:transposase